MKKGLKIVGGILGGILVLLLLVAGAVHAVLNTGLLNRLVDKFAAEYVQGDITFSKVKGSVFRSFPFLNIAIDDFALTYPHERYAAWDTVYTERVRRFSLLKAGYGTDGEVDTLASFRRLEVSLNYMDVLKGRYNIPKAELSHPRIFAHYYDSTAANWDILPLGSDDPDDTTSSGIPPLKLHRIALTDRPVVVFTQPIDTLMASLRMKQMTFDGDLDTEALEESVFSLGIDSLRVSGRLPADTLAVRLNRLGLDFDHRYVGISAEGRAMMRTGAFGRMRLPFSLLAEGSYPSREDSVQRYDIDTLNVRVSSLEVVGAGMAIPEADRTYLKGRLLIDDCPLGELVDEFSANFPALGKIRTDAILNARAHFDGYWVPSTGQIPELDARIRIPDAYLDYDGLGRTGRLSLDATASTDADIRLDVDVKKLIVNILGAHLNLRGTGRDLTGKDPLLTLDGKVSARVDSLTRAFTAEQGISGLGSLDADLHAKARLSQLTDMGRIGQADIRCDALLRGLDIHDGPDSLDAWVNNANLKLLTRGNQIDTNMRQGARVLALEADIDSLKATLGSTQFIKGKGICLRAQNSAAILRGGDQLTPLMGILKVKGLSFRDGDATRLDLQNSTERFRITPATEAVPTPRLKLDSKSDYLRVRTGEESIGIQRLAFQVNASKHQSRARSGAMSERRRHYMDSLQRVYPGVPRDSLLTVARRNRAVPSWMREQDFRASDINISLSDALMKYYREWDIEGALNFWMAQVLMPRFPLRIRVTNADGKLTNDRIEIQKMKVVAGVSNLSARASLKGLRRAILRRGSGTMELDAALSSDRLDVNELMRAYAYYVTSAPVMVEDSMSEDQLEASIRDTELPDSVNVSPLIVLPANLNANLSLESTGIRYDSLQVNWAATDIALRQRTLQITNTVAASNMGDIYFEGFYSTQAKDDIKAGFDLSLVDITAEKVITLFPAVDSLMPMLKSFAGDLDCELAATTRIDTMMNLVIPSVDGIMRISGKDLTVHDSPEFTKIAKLLRFKNREKAIIDKMSVTGMVRDNTLEVFPFVLDVDRYMLAASGIQHFDESFNYHISIIRSPLPVKFGVNIWGDDFDNLQYAVVKAKYKDANVPVFTKQLDTVQYSLLASIHNIFEVGVEKAIAENRQQQYIQNGMDAAGFSAESDPTEGILSLQENQDMDRLLENLTPQEAEERLARLRAEVVEMEEKAAVKREDE